MGVAGCPARHCRLHPAGGGGPGRGARRGDERAEPDRHPDRQAVGGLSALLPGGVVLEEMAGENLAGPSVLILAAPDLDAAPAEEWQALGAQAVVSAQPGPWVALANGGWVHISTDGVRMWVEEGR